MSYQMVRFQMPLPHNNVKREREKEGQLDVQSHQASDTWTWAILKPLLRPLQDYKSKCLHMRPGSTFRLTYDMSHVLCIGMS